MGLLEITVHIHIHKCVSACMCSECAVCLYICLLLKMVEARAQKQQNTAAPG